jgi:hypothetical protein
VKPVAAVLAPFLLILAGCLSAPIPQELVDVGPAPAAEPLSTREIVRLSKAGIADEVIVGLIRSRGLADRPSAAGIAALEKRGVSGQVRLYLLALPADPPARTPQPRIVYRELFIPLWPSYARGRWHLGLRIGCYTRTVGEQLQEILPQEPPEELPRFIDP